MTKETALQRFEQKQVRSLWNEEEEKWYFSIVDVVVILSESPNPNNYWKVLKNRLKKEGSQLVTDCNQLKMFSSDGKYYKTDVADTEQLFRLIQSIPSPKAEPFKLWLAQVGKERMEEIEDPELAVERMRELYIAKGYPTEWIETRIRSIDIRKQLTDEWKARKVKEGTEYAILTAEIAKATFDLTPSEHKQFKGLDKQNLRDHMTNLELIFTMLGEEATRHIAVEENAQGFEENRDAAIQGGRLAGKARRNVEEDKRFKVTSSENFLNLKETNSSELPAGQDEIKP